MALLGRPRLSTTRSYRGDASNRFMKANEGDLFCDDILSFIGGESSVEDNEDGYTLAAGRPRRRWPSGGVGQGSAVT